MEDKIHEILHEQGAEAAARVEFAPEAAGVGIDAVMEKIGGHEEGEFGIAGEKGEGSVAVGVGERADHASGAGAGRRQAMMASRTAEARAAETPVLGQSPSPRSAATTVLISGCWT